MLENPTQPDVNSWLEDELFQQYKHDRKTVDATWTPVLEGNGHTATPSATATAVAEPPRALTVRSSEVPAVVVAEGEQLTPLRGPALRIAENMTASLTIPIATSQRVIPVKAIEENRRVINQHRACHGAGQALLHAPDRLGHRARARQSSRRELCVRGRSGEESFAWPREGQPGNRRGHRGPGRLAVAEGPEH